MLLARTNLQTSDSIGCSETSHLSGRLGLGVGQLNVKKEPRFNERNVVPGL